MPPFRSTIASLAALALLPGCVHPFAGRSLPNQHLPSRGPASSPPALHLQVLQHPNPVPAEVLPLRAAGIEATLFLPVGWERFPHRLAIHFHTSPTFALGEHRRAGYQFPLVSIFLGSGSARYRAPFTDPTRFPALIERIEQELAQRSNHPVPLDQIDVSSFSAGYGAVRELVGQPFATSRIQRIVLSDSLYAGLTQGADGTTPRVVQPDQIRCWAPFARQAIAGTRTFVLTVSRIHTPAYASTPECANALVHELGLDHRWHVPAPAPGPWPLLRHCDAGNFHVWCYDGTEADAHLVHPRTLADVWQTLDATPSPSR